MRPLAIDLYCGLGGWTVALIAEGYQVIGFDIERHQYGAESYPGQLVIQDVLTLHGSQFKDAVLIVASPPCQFFSYTAMPWTKAKDRAKATRADPALLEKELALFNACFRIQREACEAAARHIPMIVENVRGAIPWVGRSRWNYGSFHLWGDVPALMPSTFARMILKDGVANRTNGETNFHGGAKRASDGIKIPSFRFDGSGSFQMASVNRTAKGSGNRFTSRSSAEFNGASFQSASVEHSDIKALGMNWSNLTKRGQDFTRIAGKRARDCRMEGIKCGSDWFNASQPSISRQTGSKSLARKAASAMIARIPTALASHIAKVYFNGL